MCADRYSVNAGEEVVRGGILIRDETIRLGIHGVCRFRPKVEEELLKVHNDKFVDKLYDLCKNS